MKGILFIVVLLCLVGTASATDYYIDANTGNDGDNGESLVNAWLTLEYADGQLSAGDTLHLVDGTWNGEHFVFSASGTDGNVITITAHNGTPIMDGGDITSGTGITTTGHSYINISGIEIRNYNVGIYVRESAQVHISDVNVWNISQSTSPAIHFLDCNYSSLKDSNVHDTGWNSVSVQANNDDFDTGNITIQNNTIHDNPGVSGGEGHALIDLFNYGGSRSVSDIDILDNTLYNNPVYSAIFEHGETVFTMYRINISDNIIHDTKEMRASYLRDSIVNNNQIYDQTGYGIMAITACDNVSFYNNSIINTTYSQVDLNVVEGGEVTFTEDDITYYRINDGKGIVTDPVNTSYQIRSVSGGNVTLRYTSGLVFSENGANSTRYYNSYSQYNTTGDETVTISTKNTTLKPASGYGNDVVVNIDLVDDVSNITLNVSTPCNVLMNFTVDNATHTYNFSVDGVFNYSAVSGSDSVVRLNYTFGSSTPTDFEVAWASTEGWSPTDTWYTNVTTTMYSNGTTAWLYTQPSAEDTVVQDSEFNVSITGSGGGSDVLEDSYATTNRNDYQSVGSALWGWGQAFSAPNTSTLSRLDLFLANGSGSHDFTMQGELYAATGTLGLDAVGTGSPLATTEIKSSNILTSTYTLISFNFTGSYELIENDEYVVIVRIVEWTEGAIRYGSDSSTPTHEGNMARLGVSTWTNYSAYDCIFYVYSEEDAVASIDVNVTEWNPSSSGLVATNNITNISATVDTINILLNVTRDTWNYNLTYSNGTEISNQTATSTNESLNFSIPLVEDSYNITESSTGAADTKFEYWTGSAWVEDEAQYYLWFTCFWWTSGYPDGVAPNAEQSSGQPSLKIINNGSAAGTPKMKLNESAPANVKVFVDDDNTYAGSVELTDTYQAVSTSLSATENVTIWAWVNLTGPTSLWEFEVYAINE